MTASSHGEHGDGAGHVLRPRGERARNRPPPPTRLDATILQDPHISDGVSRFLFEHDTESAYFMLELRAGGPPRAIGVCRVIAGSFGGDARANLTSDLSLPVTGRPQILFGDATTSVPIPAVA